MRPRPDLGRKEAASGLLAQACRLSGQADRLVNAARGVCGECIRARPAEAVTLARGVHARTRRAFELPAAPPQAAEGVPCSQCAQDCRIPEGERGY